MNRARFQAWLVAGAAAVAAVVLKDLGGLLGDIQTAGERSYGASVFTGFRLNVFDTTQLVDAVEVWRIERDVVLRLLRAHAAIDALVFIPASAAIIVAALARVGARARFATFAAWAYFGVNELETVLTGIVLPDLVAGSGPVGSSFWLIAIQTLSLAKWLVLLASAIVAVVALVKSDDGIQVADGGDAIARARAGGAQSPAQALAGLLVLVSLFAALVALPAGGPLDQLPDVIREHLSEGGLTLWGLATLGVALFIGAVVVAGFAATSPGGAKARAETLRTPAVLAGTFVLSVVLSLVAWRIDGEVHLASWAPFLFALGLYAAAKVAGWAGVAGQEPAASTAGEPKGRPAPELDWTEGAVVWVGSLAGVVGIVWAVGLVRAAFPPLILGIEEGSFPWWLATALGFAGCLGIGFILEAAVAAIAPRPLRKLHRVVASVVIAAVLLAAVWLAWSPGAGRLWGSTGVVGVGLGFWALVIGALVWVSRTRPRWDVTRCLGFGARTPWVTLLLVLGLVSSMLNREGGYHDARLTDAHETPRYADVDAAFEEWIEATTTECSPAPGEPIPMVFVAAPGGGIRAAYWTVSVLDELFSPACGSTHLFAASGVSGGSVGAATWVAAVGRGEPALVAVTEMSKDEALPSALAGLLLRDIPQPLTAITDGWDDRAALMERGWSDAAGVFGPSSDPAGWSSLGDGGHLPFVPVLVLNGSSVTDGCRVLVTNVAELPATLGPDCQGVPTPPNGVSGPVSGSIDAFASLRGRDSSACGPTVVDLPITTGALLSARFPLVSPSGALVRCSGGEETTTYVVDGGYYENSGLLTLLQVWEGVEDDVAAYNGMVGVEGSPVENPIEPWFLLVDNHYRASAKKAPSGRPLEILAPLVAKRQDVLSQTMLEQAAIWEMGEGPDARFARLAPAVHPGVEAPLGWVLSAASRNDLAQQLQSQLADPDESLRTLLELLELEPEP